MCAIRSLLFEMFGHRTSTLPRQRPREWVEEMNFDRVQRGLIQKRKIFNDAPAGISGHRLQHFKKGNCGCARHDAANRDELIKKLFFNE